MSIEEVIGELYLLGQLTCRVGNLPIMEGPFDKKEDPQKYGRATTLLRESLLSGNFLWRNETRDPLFNTYAATKEAIDHMKDKYPLVQGVKSNLQRAGTFPSICGHGLVYFTTELVFQGTTQERDVFENHLLAHLTKKTPADEREYLSIHDVIRLRDSRN